MKAFHKQKQFRTEDSATSSFNTQSQLDFSCISDADEIYYLARPALAPEAS